MTRATDSGPVSAPCHSLEGVPWKAAASLAWSPSRRDEECPGLAYSRWAASYMDTEFDLAGRIDSALARKAPLADNSRR